MVNQMLRLMEEAWIGDQLESFHQHPMNRGWMNAFRRWTPLRRIPASLGHSSWPVYGRVREVLREGAVLRTKSARPHSVSITAPQPPPQPPPQQVNNGGSPRMPPGERDCDSTRPRPTTPPSSFVGGPPVVPPPPPLTFSTDDPLWSEAYRDINHEFQLEWTGLRWKGLGNEGVGLDPLVAAASRSVEGEAIDSTRSRVWLVTIPRATRLRKHENRGEPLKVRICGIILIWNRDADGDGTDVGDPYELFIWLQGPYRTMGVGREALALVLDQFWEGRSNKTFSIKTRYPIAGAAGSVNRWQAGIWLNFFNLFAFRNVRHLAAQDVGTPGPEEPDDLVVQRTFYPELWPSYQQDRERAKKAGKGIAGVIASTRHSPPGVRCIDETLMLAIHIEGRSSIPTFGSRPS